MEKQQKKSVLYRNIEVKVFSLHFRIVINNTKRAFSCYNFFFTNYFAVCEYFSQFKKSVFNQIFGVLYTFFCVFCACS